MTARKRKLLMSMSKAQLVDRLRREESRPVMAETRANRAERALRKLAKGIAKLLIDQEAQYLGRRVV